MAVLKNATSGICVEVSDDKAEALLASGYVRRDAEPEPEPEQKPRARKK